MYSFIYRLAAKCAAKYTLAAKYRLAAKSAAKYRLAAKCAAKYRLAAECAAKYRLGSWHCNALTDGQRWAASRAMSSSRDHRVLTIQAE